MLLTRLQLLTAALEGAGMTPEDVETIDGDTTLRVGTFDVLVSEDPVFPAGDFHYLARGPVSKTEGVDSGWMREPDEVVAFLRRHGNKT